MLEVEDGSFCEISKIYRFLLNIGLEYIGNLWNSGIVE